MWALNGLGGWEPFGVLTRCLRNGALAFQTWEDGFVAWGGLTQSALLLCLLVVAVATGF